MFSDFLIENYVRTSISLGENRCFGFGIVEGHGGSAPYQVAVLIGFEDVENWNHDFNLAWRSLFWRLRECDAI